MDLKNLGGISQNLKNRAKYPSIRIEEISVTMNKCKVKFKFTGFEGDKVVYLIQLKNKDRIIINYENTCNLDSDGIGTTFEELDSVTIGKKATLNIFVGKTQQRINIDLQYISQLKQQEDKIKNILMEQYLQKVEDYEKKKSMSVYSSLFLDITPAIQKIMGYCRYELKEEQNDDKILSVLNYYLGPNLTNILLNKRFELTEKGFEFKNSNLTSPVETESDLKKKEISLELLLDQIEILERSYKLFEIYNACYQVFLEIGVPIFGILQMIQRNKLDRDMVYQFYELLETVYQKNGFIFCFYEELKEGSTEANSFIKGREYDIDYPAVYRDGQVYCSMDGCKK